MILLNVLTLTTFLAVGQLVPGSHPDRVNIPSGRPQPTNWLTFKNGRAVVTGAFERERNRVYLVTVDRELSIGDEDGPAQNKRIVQCRSSVTELDVGTVLPIGNALVRLLSGDQFTTSGRRVRDMEFESLAKGLGDGIIGYLSGAIRVGEDDTFWLEAIEVDADTSQANFSGRIFHRKGSPAEIDLDATIFVKKAKAGDVIQIADLKLRVLNVVPPDKALRITGWMAFELP